MNWKKGKTCRKLKRRREVFILFSFYFCDTVQTTETILLERCLNGLESSRALNCALLEIMAAKAKIPLGKVWLPYVQQGTSFQAPARYWRELLQSHLSVLDCLKLKLKRCSMELSLLIGGVQGIMGLHLCLLQLPGKLIEPLIWLL